MTELNQDELLRIHYLLGELSDEEKSSLEERFFLAGGAYLRCGHVGDVLWKNAFSRL